MSKKSGKHKIKLREGAMAFTVAVLVAGNVSGATLANIFSGSITLKNTTYESAAYSAGKGQQVAHTNSTTCSKTGYVQYTLAKKNILGKYKTQSCEFLKYTKGKQQYGTCTFKKTASGSYKCVLSTEEQYTTNNGYDSCETITFKQGYLTMK